MPGLTHVSAGAGGRAQEVPAVLLRGRRRHRQVGRHAPPLHAAVAGRPARGPAPAGLLRLPRGNLQQPGTLGYLYRTLRSEVTKIEK